MNRFRFFTLSHLSVSLFADFALLSFTILANLLFFVFVYFLFNFYSLFNILFHFSFLFSSFLHSSIIAMAFFPLIASYSFYSLAFSLPHFILSTFYSHIPNNNKKKSLAQTPTDNICSYQILRRHTKMVYCCTFLRFEMIRNFRTQTDSTGTKS